MSQEQEYKRNLDRAREKDHSNDNNDKGENKKEEKNKPAKKSPQKKLLDNLKKASDATMAIIFSIEIRDIFFMLAIAMAALKDISDFVGIGSFPLTGTSITIMASITIAVGMLVSGNYGSGKKNKSNVKKAVKKWGVLVGGTMMESLLFGINFLPVETITALITFGMVLIERAELKKEENNNDEDEYVYGDMEEEY